MNITEFSTRACEWTPVVTCGVARSGTRMIADLLNQHAEIEVEAEMHAKTIEAYFALLEQVQANFNHYSERKGRRLDANWQSNKNALHHLFLATASKCPAERPFEKDIKYHAFKTPGYERYFENFERAFEPVKPLYIYAIRDVGKVWRSWASLNYLDDLELFRTRYSRSLRQANKINRMAPDRLAVFDLEGYIKASDKRSFVVRTVFTPLGIEDKVVWPPEGVSNKNSAECRGYSLIDNSQMQQQMADLRADPNLQMLRDSLVGR